MILRNRVDRRVSAPSLVVGLVLAALALPSWTLADGPAVGEVQVKVIESPAVPNAIEVGKPVHRVVVIATNKDDAPTVEVLDDDDDDAAPDEKEKKEKKTIRFKVQRDDLTKQMEALSKELEAKFGDDSDIVKEIEKAFGPGSDFAKKMETFEKEMKAKFGPDSEFGKKMEALGKLHELKIMPDAKFSVTKDGPKVVEDADAKKPKVRFEVKAEANTEKAKALAAKVREEAAKTRADAKKSREEALVKLKERARVEVRAKAAPASDKRARRIEALESLINELRDELKQLKDESTSSEENGEN